MASSVPSAACAEATNPGWSRTLWWWWQFTVSDGPTSAREPAAGLGRDRHRAEHVAARAVLVVPHQVGRVLVEAPARVHRHHLHAAADAEHRQGDRRPRPSRRASSQASRSGRQLAVRGCGSASYWAGSTSAPPLITSPSRRATTVSAAPVVVDGRQQHGYAAARDHRLGVLRGQQVGALVPHPPPGLLAVGGETDQRVPAHRGVT